MNTAKAGNYGKIIAFFLIAVILLCAFGFAADGWQSFAESGSDSSDADGDIGEADDDKNPTPSEPKEPEIYIPQYVNVVSGLETTDELSRLRPVAFLMDSSAPLYGISEADIMIEFPTESGATRLLALTSDPSSLGKIGSLAPTRDYISNLAKHFGAILVSNGCDDSIEYDALDISSSHLDLSLHSGYHYTEFTHFAYTNGALINAGISNANIGTALNTRQSLPYVFTDFGAERITYDVSAKSILLPYSSSSETELYYSEADGKYTFSKGGSTKTDMLTDKATSFDNVFVLFADTITYESSEGVEMVMDTMTSGNGYYITGGGATEICWEITPSGSMIFRDQNGSTLTINRGTSYIGFMKSSLSEQISFS